MVSVLDKWLLNTIYRVIGEAPVRISLWNGTKIGPSLEMPIAHVHIRSRRALLRLFINPELYFGDAYSNGDIQLTGDLVQFLEKIYQGMSRSKRNWLQRQIVHWQARPRCNSLHGSKENIHKHYDIGNQFYRMWLDKKMLYTCAYYPSPHGMLEQAQEEKMHHIARKLLLKPGETVVEAGCGWGSLALHLARHYGVKVHAYNISHQQIIHARQRAREEGLDKHVTFIEDDYRNIQGKFDAFVSVGMLEHVGVNNYEELGNTIKRCLKEDGRGLIHSIGRNQPARMNAWIERRIFPGAYPPTLRETMDIFEPENFSVLDVENIRLHYALTLRHWLERFEKNTDQVGNMFDEEFVRAWRLYLAGSIAAFSTGALQLYQIVFAPGASNKIPWTRDHIYRKEEEAEWKQVM
ncbi:cyclopropane-fatty-acyl-phospholipid synthase family protein [Sulfuriflexus sp.]|uniref:cyclopropane-fatty-acyl-phospholipid synthase family protein n=1 Tax=Sulfuriflexus sp. TaxID=2015443 RepID=UPI0028CDF594|nr:cyclopropane-fatty-acyl-phospholipid synthase family protein [Sulfuriflexus sp.]MDT8405110.1 cyclopropane-fatty-acyl-phospholipid synthase family protein [Sulfuriflexus sp.]